MLVSVPPVRRLFVAVSDPFEIDAVGLSDMKTAQNTARTRAIFQGRSTKTWYRSDWVRHPPYRHVAGCHLNSLRTPFL